MALSVNIHSGINRQLSGGFSEFEPVLGGLTGYFAPNRPVLTISGGHVPC